MGPGRTDVQGQVGKARERSFGCEVAEGWGQGRVKLGLCVPALSAHLRILGHLPWDQPSKQM